MRKEGADVSSKSSRELEHSLTCGYVDMQRMRFSSILLKRGKKGEISTQLDTMTIVSN